MDTVSDLRMIDYMNLVAEDPNAHDEIAEAVGVNPHHLQELIVYGHIQQIEDNESGQTLYRINS